MLKTPTRIFISDPPSVKTDTQNAEAFANHLSEMFTPNQINPSANIMHENIKVLEETVQSNTPLKTFSENEIKAIMSRERTYLSNISIQCNFSIMFYFSAMASGSDRNDFKTW